MKNASLAVCAKIPSEPNRSYRRSRKSTALAVMRRNMRLDASNVIRYGISVPILLELLEFASYWYEESIFVVLIFAENDGRKGKKHKHSQCGPHTHTQTT